MAQREHGKGSARGGKSPTPAVGDSARVPADTRNEFHGYERAPRAEASRQPIDGIIAAIREISSGQPVKVAAGDARRYVFDLLHDRTFDPRVSSKSNSAGAAPDRLEESEMFVRVQGLLRQMAGRAAPASGCDALGKPPLHGVLDGWRLIRVWAAHVQVRAPREQG